MKRIMVVEDDPNILENVIELLSFMDYDVCSATNAIDGLSVIKDKMPDLILADVLMPLRTGYELIEDVRSDSNIQHIPIVLMSAHADNISRERGIETGADAYIVKPFREEELQEVLNSLLSS